MADERGQLGARRQPETLRLRALTPALTVADLDKSLTWYCDLVGFVVVDKWEEGGRIVGAVIEAGRMRLFLVQADGAKQPSQNGGTRFHCMTAQPIDELAAAIESRGVPLASAPKDQSWGARTFDLIDPDGYRLTISSVVVR